MARTKAALLLPLLLSSMSCGPDTHFDNDDRIWVTDYGDSIPQGLHELCEDLDQLKSEIVSSKTELNSKTRYLYVRRPKPDFVWDKYMVLGQTIEQADDEDPEVVDPTLNIEVSEVGRTNWASLRPRLIGRRIVQRLEEINCEFIYVPGQQELLNNFSGLVIFRNSNATYIRYRVFVFRDGRIVQTKAPILKEHGL